MSLLLTKSPPLRWVPFADVEDAFAPVISDAAAFAGGAAAAHPQNPAEPFHYAVAARAAPAARESSFAAPQLVASLFLYLN